MPTPRLAEQGRATETAANARVSLSDKVHYDEVEDAAALDQLTRRFITEMVAEARCVFISSKGIKPVPKGKDYEDYRVVYNSNGGIDGVVPLKEEERRSLQSEGKLRVQKSVNSSIQEGRPLALYVSYDYHYGYILDLVGGAARGDYAARVAQVETNQDSVTPKPVELLVRKGETLEVTLPDGQTMQVDAMKAVVRKKPS